MIAAPRLDPYGPLDPAIDPAIIALICFHLALLPHVLIWRAAFVNYRSACWPTLPASPLMN